MLTDWKPPKDDVLNDFDCARGSNGDKAKPKTRSKTIRPSKASFGQPKPPRSAFVCFVDDRKKINAGNSAGDDEDDFQEAAAAWGLLTENERAQWDRAAQDDKIRFAKENQAYKGPKHVPKRRAKKNPLAPKRPPSAFLMFSGGRRELLKRQNPHLVNQDITRLLGQMWRNLTNEEREPFDTKTKTEHAAYKIKIQQFKEDELRKDAASRSSHSAISQERSSAKAEVITGGYPKPTSFDQIDPLPVMPPLPTIPQSQEDYFQRGMLYSADSLMDQPRHYQLDYQESPNYYYDHPYDNGCYWQPMNDVHPLQGNLSPQPECQRHGDSQYDMGSPLGSFRHGAQLPPLENDPSNSNIESNMNSLPETQLLPYPNLCYSYEQEQNYHQQHYHQRLSHAHSGHNAIENNNYESL